MDTLLKQILFVGLGGCVGSIGRFLIGVWVQRGLRVTSFPIGTLTVNILGCFLIGILGGLSDLKGVLHPQMRLLLMVGVLGGFTTFSSFGYETMALLRDAEYGLALLNTGGSVILGCAAVFLGYRLVAEL